MRPGAALAREGRGRGSGAKPRAPAARHGAGPPWGREPVAMHGGAAILGVAAGASGLALLLLAARAGLGPGAFFPLLVLWLVAFALAARLVARVAGRVRAGRR